MKYAGQELDLFRHATAWKRYYSRVLRRYIRGDVLEVGGGLGGTTPYLLTPDTQVHTVLEPDPDLFGQLEQNLRDHVAEGRVRLIHSTVSALAPEPQFDVILYIDVLEHIEDDRAELVESAKRLRPGGAIAVLSPAFEALRSPFDDALGHWRRYTIKSLQSVFPDGFKFVCARYFDSVGAGLSLGNRLVTRDEQPTAAQIRFWNRFIIPVSVVVDPLLRRWWGRSVQVIGRKISPA